ncbi:class I SAM-dependent methyltransferase [Lachnoclostridium phytofermentans]|uniref:Methyltransferase type 11 n=1 Tax=Lachnoclostridium phytofermentans (strain ATCC 700394 / DSM 18823 / ISDg) TaxID=357809 RepID=A9KRQ7_LACP7|nr:class I SAM-dependent methyltransferase [Lachnoclostridium phytofermentans]ABX43551.1 Methyltransferase type 11 [Lachnoclostridium phytofermentans ISDg]
MHNDSSTKCWSEAGLEWCEIAQKNDFRMFFIMPYTLQQLGNVSGKRILDLGCGEGGYSRELAQRGALVTAIDCSEFFINYSTNKAKEQGLHITHFIRNSCDLYDIQDNYFDIVLCSMMLMDCENLDGTVNEIARVLKSGGKVFASVLHPCFKGKDINWTGEGNESMVVFVKNYFFPKEWEMPPTNGLKGNVVWRHRTLEEYVKLFVKNNLRITDLNEPMPTEEQIKMSPRIGWLTKIPMFLFWELEK